MHVQSHKSGQERERHAGREDEDIFPPAERRARDGQETCPNTNGLTTGGPTAIGSPPPSAPSLDLIWARSTGTFRAKVAQRPYVQGRQESWPRILPYSVCPPSHVKLSYLSHRQAGLGAHAEPRQSSPSPFAAPEPWEKHMEIQLQTRTRTHGDRYNSTRCRVCTSMVVCGSRGQGL